MEMFLSVELFSFDESTGILKDFDKRICTGFSTVSMAIVLMALNRSPGQKHVFLLFIGQYLEDGRTDFESHFWKKPIIRKSRLSRLLIRKKSNFVLLVCYTYSAVLWLVNFA